MTDTHAREFVTKPASVIDVARFVLDELGDSTSTMKLQKLCYFAQGWTLAWTHGLELFAEDFQACRNGPVCRELWLAHRNAYTVTASDLPGQRQALQPWQGDVTRAAIEPYRYMTGYQLSALTHTGGPWVEARAGLGVNAPSTTVIPKVAIQRYFEELDDVT